MDARTLMAAGLIALAPVPDVAAGRRGGQDRLIRMSCRFVYPWMNWCLRGSTPRSLFASVPV